MAEVKIHGGFGPGFGFMGKSFIPETLLRKVSETLGREPRIIFNPCVTVSPGLSLH
jgi:hypothetical protein